MLGLPRTLRGHPCLSRCLPRGHPVPGQSHVFPVGMTLPLQPRLAQSRICPLRCISRRDRTAACSAASARADPGRAQAASCDIPSLTFQGGLASLSCPNLASPHQTGQRGRHGDQTHPAFSLGSARLRGLSRKGLERGRRVDGEEVVLIWPTKCQRLACLSPRPAASKRSTGRARSGATGKRGDSGFRHEKQ